MLSRNCVNGMLMDEECPECHGRNMVVVANGWDAIALRCLTCDPHEQGMVPDGCALVLCGVCRRFIDWALEGGNECDMCDNYECERCGMDGGHRDGMYHCKTCFEEAGLADEEEDEDEDADDKESEGDRSGSGSETGDESDDESMDED